MKSTEVQTLGVLRRARVSKRMRRTTETFEIAGLGLVLAVTCGLLPARAESDAG